MLLEFMRDHRDEIVERCRSRITARSPATRRDVIQQGVPAFVIQLEETIAAELGVRGSRSRTPAQHAGDWHERGNTVAQVVHDYGDACQAIAEIVLEHGTQMSTDEFRALNKCLDDSIAHAVTTYEHDRDRERTFADPRRLNRELGSLAHELRGAIGTATLAFEILRSGHVGIMGSTGGVLARSLVTLRDLADRSLTEVQLAAGIECLEPIVVSRFLEDVEIGGMLGARSHGIKLSVEPAPPELVLYADRQILASVVANLLYNAFSHTATSGHVWLRTQDTPTRVSFEVEDDCGGVAAHPAEAGFDLAICARGVHVLRGEMNVRHDVGGCVVTVDLPRSHVSSAG